MELQQSNHNTIGDLFKELERMGFVTGEMSLNNYGPYRMLKDYFQKHMGDEIPNEVLRKHASEISKSDDTKETHFQKRDLDEAEEY